MLKRSVTAFFLILIGVAVILLGSWPLLVWVVFSASIVGYELFEMMKKKEMQPVSALGLMVIVAIVGSPFFVQAQPIWNSWVTKGLVAAVLCLSIFELATKRLWVPKSNILATLKMSLFVSLTITFVYLVREGHNGFENLLFGCIIIWTSDSVALLAGKAIGRHKLTTLSPKKTIEGSIAGVLGSVMVGAIFIYVVDLPLMLYLPLAAVISVVSQLADLHESLTKRHFGVKDSSNLLPGHGGFYDRADGYLLVMPIIYYLFNG